MDRCTHLCSIYLVVSQNFAIFQVLLFKIAHWMCPSPRMQSSFRALGFPHLYTTKNEHGTPKNHLSKKKENHLPTLNFFGCPNVDFPRVKHHFLVSFFLLILVYTVHLQLSFASFFLSQQLGESMPSNAESTCDTDLTSATSVEVWTPVNGHVVEQCGVGRFKNGMYNML